MKSVYIETTIPNLATGRPSRDTIIAGRQAATMLFWENERIKYDLFISQYVLGSVLSVMQMQRVNGLRFYMGFQLYQNLHRLTN